MRQLFISILFFTTAACGQSFKAETYSTQKSSSSIGSNQTSGTQVEPPTTTTPTTQVNIIDAAGAALLANNLLPVLIKMFKGFVDLTKIDYTKSTQTISSSQTVACPQGGTLTASGTGTLNLSVSFLAIGGTVNNGSGTLVFTNCSIATGVVLNGTTNILALTATLVGALNANTASTFNLTGNHNLAGNVNVTYQGKTQNCALTLNDALTSDGTFTLVNPVVSGTATAHVTGTACNSAVDVTKTETF